MVFSGEVGFYDERMYGRRSSILATEDDAVEFATERVSVAKEGDGFGELALLSDQPRGLTARTETTSQLVYISKTTFDKLVALHGKKADDDVVLTALRAPPEKRTAQQHGAVVSWAREHIKLGDAVRVEQLTRAMELVELAEDTVLFRKGDEGDSYYVVFKGEVGMYDEAASSSHGDELVSSLL